MRSELRHWIFSFYSRRATLYGSGDGIDWNWSARPVGSVPENASASKLTYLAEPPGEEVGRDSGKRLAQERLGDPLAVAREFDRIPAGWRPGLIVLPLLALMLACLAGFSLWHWSRRLPVSPLQVAFVGTYLAGFFGVLGSGLIATSAFLTTWRRPLRERERRSVRQLLRKLARLAVVSIPVSVALRTLWQGQFIPNQWTLWSYHLRWTGVLVSVALLTFAQCRPAASDRVRWLTAIFASLVIFFSSFGTSIRVADIPVAWVCVVFLAGQVLVALPRFRIRIVRLREPN